ncbi:MAG TPA: hypothetical protein VFY36_00260 [Solirubrobacteraceae bacterium]|nr:hypothetical protein [Solirubrobacteraceae bacterium]
MAFPVVCSRLTLAVVGPRATGTQAAAIERQITTIHPANPHRIFDVGH